MVKRKISWTWRKKAFIRLKEFFSKACSEKKLSETLHIFKKSFCKYEKKIQKIWMINFRKNKTKSFFISRAKAFESLQKGFHKIIGKLRETVSESLKKTFKKSFLQKCSTKDFHSKSLKVLYLKKLEERNFPEIWSETIIKFHYFMILKPFKFSFYLFIISIHNFSIQKFIIAIKTRSPAHYSTWSFSVVLFVFKAGK